MAATNIAAQQLLGSYPALPLATGASAPTFVPGDVSNGNVTPIVNNKTIVIAHNSDTASHHITISSVADSFARKGDITADPIAAGAIAIYGPFPTSGWANAGNLGIQVDNAAILLAVITLP